MVSYKQDNSYISSDDWMNSNRKESGWINSWK